MSATCLVKMFSFRDGKNEKLAAVSAGSYRTASTKI